MFTAQFLRSYRTNNTAAFKKRKFYID